MSSIVEQIENEIASFQAGAVKSNTGRIVAIADGVPSLRACLVIQRNDRFRSGRLRNRLES